MIRYRIIVFTSYSAFRGTTNVLFFEYKQAKKTLYVTRSHANIYCNVNKKKIDTFFTYSGIFPL